MRFRHLLPLSALAAWVGVAAPALGDPVSATATFNFRVGTTAPTTAATPPVKPGMASNSTTAELSAEAIGSTTSAGSDANASVRN